MKSEVIAILSSALALCGCQKQPGIIVTNNSDVDRTDEVVELSDSAFVAGLGVFALEDANGQQVPYQVLANGNLVFPASVAANSQAAYTIVPGAEPMQADTLLAFTFRPDCQDDLAWENEHSGYRLYGPSFRAQGGTVHGYDLWSKRGKEPLVKRLYDLDHGPEKISYHIDHGEGFDGYTVGPTLGAGACALVHADSLLYSTAYRTYEVIDFGPLRFTVKFVIDTLMAGETPVVEERYITLDRGARFNKVSTRFTGLDTDTEVAAGVVVHADNPEGYLANAASGTIAVIDLSDNLAAGNGEIYVGAVVPGATEVGFMPFAEVKANAVGQVVAKRPLKAGEAFEYYFGSGWSKGSVKDSEEWNKIVEEQALKAASPLSVKRN